jgi:signal transduction histidine kinase/adenylate kinase
LLDNVGLYIENFSGIPYSDEENKTLMRFGKVFQQTYTRFLDLQKAEAQARESQIQLALERVRARTMAMRKSDELTDVAALLFKQVSDLGIKVWSTGFKTWSDDNNFCTDYVTNPQGGFIEPYIIDSTQYSVFSDVSNAKKRGDEFFVNYEEGEQLAETYQQLSKCGEKQFKAILDSGFQFPSKQYEHHVFGSKASLMFITYEPIPEAYNIFIHLGNVFEQTYTRFLDLQKAETQAREARIEAALERVRASTMSMHKSEDLAKTAAVLFAQLSALGNTPDRMSIGIIDEPAGIADMWLTDQSGNEIDSRFILNLNEKTTVQKLVNGWKAGLKSTIIDLTGEELKTWLNYVREIGLIVKDEHFKNRRVHNVAFFSHGWLNISALEPLSPDMINILERFAAVYSLTYRRFLDLKKAEAQAREAQIEASLERVRARTMAMHTSDDVSAATATMFNELEKLGIENYRGGILNIRNDQTMEVWSINTGADGSIIRAIGLWDMTLHPWWQLLYKGWFNKDEFLYYFLAGKDKEDYIKLLNARPDYLPTGIHELPDCHIQAYYFGEGAVWTFSLQPHLEEHKQIMKRFASVFSLTFRRYQDLRKAEAQAREAKIEAALERVRGRAMAMQSSNELSDLVSILFEELTKLDLVLARCIIWILDPETFTARVWMANSEDKKTADSYFIRKLDHPYYDAIIEGWKQRQQEWVYDLKGIEKKSIDQLLLNETELSKLSEAVKKGIATSEHTIVSCSFNNFGFIEASGPFALTNEQMDILSRFAKVFDLTYTRFNDLQIAEANAKEVVKQAALDRIRADIASMRTISDLDRITPLIWNELTVLGIPFIRCGVFIMDDAQKFIHTFLSTPEGKAIAAFHLPYNTPGHFPEIVSHWRDKEIYVSRWNEKDFISIGETLVKQGAISTKEQYLGTLPKGQFYLHFLPFLQGMLYVGNTAQLGEEEIKLIQPVADAFSTAYARYEDFNKLEAAKQQVEKTLTDLKQTQQQLIQAEKMASLGELTAGIAHEIQNPLNFVNNFSEVNVELVDELKGERSKAKGERNEELENEILNDVKQNLEKILHHGKRADAIVKGMLQHSRVSTGQKEPTDINALTDEYLRLSYHGLRAKDKTFNATIKTDFDATIGKVNIVPQDIGRVLLNLFNNAFYATGERCKVEGVGYEPLVSVRTEKVDDTVAIHVTDNGIGIPQKVVDKIFQPFFTTKPTGQGTGLGLSLSYDIIKAHRGEIKVETKEGEGATFIILLPFGY